MADNNKIKHELANQLFDVKEKLTDEEYKTLIETVTQIKDQQSTNNQTQPPTMLSNQLLIQQIDQTFYKKCTYPDCNKKISVFLNYCREHSSSAYRKTTDTKCEYKDTAGTQCLNNSKIGSVYCKNHIVNHNPKPPKKVSNTGTEICEYIIKPKAKFDKSEGKRCKKYALLGKKYCSLHSKNEVIVLNVEDI